MSARYLAHPLVEVSGQREERYVLCLPDWGRQIEATAYQYQLLRRFERPATIGAVLEAYPFHRASSAAFLELCVAEQFLLLADEQGRPRWPSTRRVETTMFRAPHAVPETPAAVTFLGIPLDTNTTGAPGARFGPGSIRAASDGCRYGLDPATLLPRGFIDHSSGRIVVDGVTIGDAGDVYIATGEDPSDMYDRITQAAESLFASGTLPVFLGGDHSVTYPILRAVPYEEVGILHFDAHSDRGDVEPSGLHHGNVFSVVLERLEFVKSIVQFGLRGVYEADPTASDPRVTAVGIDQLRESDFASVLERIPAGRPYYLSVDIDVVDPAFAPSTGTPVAGGLFPHELKRWIRGLCEARNIIGMDVVEVGPSIGPADSTANVALEAIITMADGVVRRLRNSPAVEDSHDE